MENGNGLVPIDKINLFVQLDNYKLITEMNDHLFVDHPLAKEQLAREFERLDGYLDDVDRWELQGECVKYQHAIVEAKAALDTIRSLINEILSQ
jgi:hypothetical protein